MYDHKKHDTIMDVDPETFIYKRLEEPIDMTWEDIKTSIRPCLTPTGWGDRLIGETAQLAHSSYLDLSVYYHIRSENVDTKHIQIAWMTHTTLELFGVTLQVLEEQALKNMHKDGYTIQPINDILRVLLDEQDISRDIGHDHLYVLTNQNMFFGATGILDKTMVTAFAESIGTDLYILPSSIHEILLFPDLGLVDTDRSRSWRKSIPDR